MGAKLVVFNDREPDIGITMEYVPPGTPGKAMGWHGVCTECGKPVHFWNQARAFAAGQEHVDQH
jgi:hypothetical protein